MNVQIGDRAQELAEACGGRPLAAHMVGTALVSGTADLEDVLQAVASPAVAHLQPLDRCLITSSYIACSPDATHSHAKLSAQLPSQPLSDRYACHSFPGQRPRRHDLK